MRKQSEGCYSIVVAGKGTAERVSLAKQFGLVESY